MYVLLRLVEAARPEGSNPLYTYSFLLCFYTGCRRCRLLRTFKLPKQTGGRLLLLFYYCKTRSKNITVLDISENALNRAKERLGEKADSVKWVVADIVEFKPEELYDVWHDSIQYRTFFFAALRKEHKQKKTLPALDNVFKQC